ncbi:unnamed protein product [Mesocestoides corti]|uniref:Uncharacterized protein n=1 Tax=Mesocestoides corti TaxID=53468 RepID=A0A158QT08_MESCO|nr:unnamed protein product [Mesocestoides corti]
MLNSLVSSVTAFAFAAVSVADDAGGIQVNDSSLQSDAVDSKMMEKIVEKLDKFVHNVGSKACEMPSLVDKEAIERAARFIDSLLLGATATFRDLHLRLQCPLTLSGIHRACDLRLRIHLLEVNNVESESTAPSDVSSTSAASGGDGENRRGGATSHHRQRSCSKATPDAKSGTDGAAGGSSSLWSWLWANMWRLGLDSTTSRTSGNRGDGGSQSEASVPPVMRKLIRLEDVTLHWDLWDTSMGGTGQHSPASSRSNSPTCSPTVTAPSRDVYSGPTPESMIASACLLRLPTSHNYCNICLRDPSILSQILSSESTSPSARPTLVDLSIDLGPVVACICPSAVFWLTLTVTQLTTLYNTYLAGRYNDRSLDKPEDDLHKSNFGLIDSGQPFSLNRRNSVDVLTTNLVDLDLSSSPRTDLLASSGLQSMTESNMFRSCLGGSAYQGAGITVDCLSDASKLPPFTLSARCRLFVLTLFHADEEASPFTGDLSSQPLLSCGSDIETSSSGSSSSSDDQFHEVSSRQNSLTLQAPPPGSLVGINDFFAGLDGVQCLEYNDQQWVCASEWIAQVNTDLALLASPRDHLRLAAGFCQLDVTCELADDGDSTTHQRVTGQITSLLLTECLFSHAAADSLSVTKVFHVAAFLKFISL